MEKYETLVKTGNVHIERIVSLGYQSEDGFWYDQDTDEWVMVLRGKAGLEFEGQDGIVEMQEGDSVNIPAHCRHRVAWTDQGQPTVWIGIHY